MADITGTVTDDTATAVEGATVIAVDTVNDTIIGTATTAADGTYSITPTQDTTAHIYAQYDDGAGSQYTALTRPFVSVTASSVTIEDWEGATPLANWEGETDAYGTTTGTVIEGSVSLESTTTGTNVWRPMAKDIGAGAMEQGFTYKQRLQRPTGVDSDPGMIVGCQDASGTWPATGFPDSGYMFRINTNEPDVDAWEIASGAQGTSLISADPLSSFVDDRTYIMEIDWTTSDQLQMRVIDTTDSTTVYDSGLFTNTTYTGTGVYFGVITGSGTGGITDFCEKVPL